MPENVTLDGVEVIKTTDKALLIRSPDLDENVWIPRSQVIDDESDALAEGEIGTLTITAWIAREKGLDYRAGGGTGRRAGLRIPCPQTA